MSFTDKNREVLDLYRPCIQHRKWDYISDIAKQNIYRNIVFSIRSELGHEKCMFTKIHMKH